MKPEWFSRCVLAGCLVVVLPSCDDTVHEDGKEAGDKSGSQESEQVFPPLPKLSQEKGGIQEATEDLMALHVAMQRYLKANGDIWPQAPRVMMDDVVPSEQALQEQVEHQDNLVEPNAASLAAYRKFWEDTLEPFGATARHWQHSGNPPGLLKAVFYNANRFDRDKGAAYRENNGDEGQWWQTSEAVWFSIEAYGGGDKIFITASGRLVDQGVEHTVKLPAESRNQSLTRTAGNLIKVNIRHNGAYVVKGKLVTEEGLTKWMSEEFEKTPDLKVLIRCDKDSKHLYLANVMSICSQVGVQKANIAVKTEK